MLVQDVTKRVFGSAVSGFGFSLGRDTYRGTKNNAGGILFYLVILSAVFIFIGGCFCAGLFFTRNYKGLLETLVMKIIGITMLVLVGLLPSLYLINSDQPNIIGSLIVESNFQIVFFIASIPLFLMNVFLPSPEEGTTLLNNTEFIIVGVLFTFGMIVGFLQRAKRKIAWAVEEHNEQFLINHGIIETDADHIEDSSGQKFRLDAISTKYIEFFPIGRRGKRARIGIDENGRFQEWTGVFKV